jgi:teichuronic acid biosynthesis glycosyltransferase TuaC
MPPRVLVLSSVFPNPRQPAFGVFVRERVRRVARRCEMQVVAPLPWFPMNRLIRGDRWSGIPPLETLPGLPLIHHPRFFCIPRHFKQMDGLLYAASLLRFLIRLRQRFSFDVIDAQFDYPDGVGGVLLARMLRCPVTVTLRGSIVRLANYPLHRPQLRWALRAADRVISVSRSLKDTAMAIGVPGERIRVISNGVDTERFFPTSRVETREALGLPLDRRIILSIGGLNEGKGHHHVIEILPALLKRHPDLLYVIVGGGQPGNTYRPVLERMIRDRRLESHVLLVGERTHDEIPCWMGAADLFCLATRSEGWANVLLEALACGRPVVSTRVGGNPEIVTGEHLGLLAPYGDGPALERTLLEALGRRWEPETLAAYARRHSWDATADQVLEELTRLAPVGVAGDDAEATRTHAGRRS